MARPLRMNRSRPQRLIHINIAKPGDKGLVQKQGFDHAPMAIQLRGQNAGAEGRRQRLGSQTADDPVRRGGQKKTPEFARILKNKRSAAA